jgi:hypothetical protein
MKLKNCKEEIIKMNKNEIVVRFPNEEIMKAFLGQMMDGYGESFFDFTHWHEIQNPEGESTFEKQYDEEGRLICTCDSVGQLGLEDEEE